VSHQSLKQLAKRCERLGSARNACVQKPLRAIKLLNGITAIVGRLPFPSLPREPALLVHAVKCKECALDGRGCRPQVSERTLNINEALWKRVDVPKGDVVVRTIRSDLARMAAGFKLIASPSKHLIVLRERRQEHECRSASVGSGQGPSRGTVRPPEEQRQSHRNDGSNGLYPCGRSLVRLYPLEYLAHA